MAKIKTRVYDPEEVLFTADTHFYHRAQMQLRGFTDKAAMNEALVSRWNDKVQNDKTIFVLGDLTFGNTLDTRKILNQLRGIKVLIRGNHDKGLSAEVLKHFEKVADMLEIDVLCDGNKQRIFMCHYAMRVWNRHHYGSWHLYGHSHGNLADSLGRSMDVGVDTNSLWPYDFFDIAERIGGREIHQVDHHVITREV